MLKVPTGTEGPIGLAVHGPQIISAMLEVLRPEDLRMMLAARGLPCVGGRDDLMSRLHEALQAETVAWEWEIGDVGGPASFHAEMVVSHMSLFTHANSIGVFGGLDADRSEQQNLWVWDLSGDQGFQQVHYKGEVPLKMSAGHFCCVYEDELWVFPGPGNVAMRRIHCLNLQTYRWVERVAAGEPPNDRKMRRNLECILDGKRLVVYGGPQMERVWLFDFDSLTWSARKCSNGRADWVFGHALKRGHCMYALGMHGKEDQPGPCQGWTRFHQPGRNNEGPLFLPLRLVWQLDLTTFEWARLNCSCAGLQGSMPPFRLRSTSAVVENRWIIHGGLVPGRGGECSQQSFVLDLNTWRWSHLLAEGCVPMAREGHSGLGLQDCMVVVGGRGNHVPVGSAIFPPSDNMTSAVELLWWKQPAKPQSPCGPALTLTAIQRLFNNPELSDCRFVVDGCQIPAHRHVLATHSQVLARMFAQPMMEATTQEVHIKDFAHDEVLLMLQWMYGRLQSIPENHAQLIELFKLADKYDCPGLSAECVSMLGKVTWAHDVAPLLQVAHERSSAELRAVAAEVAGNCLPNVLVSLQMAPSFQELAQQQPALAMQFASECCIKGGMRFADDGSLESGKTSKANTGAASSAESSSRPSKSDDDTQAANSPAD